MASRFPSIIAACTVTTIAILTAVAARLVFHWKKRGSLGKDGYNTIILSVAYSVLAIIQTRWGLGLPIAQRPATSLYELRVLSYAGKPFYMLALAGYKLAVCLACLTMVQHTDERRYRIVVKVVAGFVVFSHVIFTLLNFLNCWPVRKNFVPSVTGYCMPFPPVQYTMAATSILCDFVVFLLPCPVLLRRIPGSGSIANHQHVFSAATLACGLLTNIVSIARAVYLKQVENGNGDNTMVVLMGVVESNVGTVMSCLPFFARNVKTRLGIQRAHSTSLEAAGEKQSSTHSVHQHKIGLPSVSVSGRDSQDDMLAESDYDTGRLEILRTLSVSQESKRSGSIESASPSWW
ncbi:hypothetical protein CAC42_7245 [Sphaceloma murrayae]|uniref:Rhodopsin domain-containing protein n=1 Tax=Sphaceloma murrayae TaxID=2082308 RepID=A0A2K1QQ86_9PEZI|nr:hypothetical protein CAC42_7245 [Sphaceloma murrayae]